MRILFLINFYPPHHFGGEELDCNQVVDGLIKRGHTVEVLTSRFRAHGGQDHVHRLLHLEMDFSPLKPALDFFISRKKNARENQEIFAQEVRKFNPDLIVIYSLWNVAGPLASIAEELLPNRVVFRFESYWPTLPSQYYNYWTVPARSWKSRIPKTVLKPLALRLLANDPIQKIPFKHTIFMSQAVITEFEKRGIIFQEKTVIHQGVKVNHFYHCSSLLAREDCITTLKLLFIGRISPEKGVHTAIEAISILTKRGLNVSLTIIGKAQDSYLQQLNEQVMNTGLSEKVNFLKFVSYEQLPEVLNQYHVMLVPSVWAEPFGRVVVEGMAAEMLVISTGAGGISTALTHEVTGLVHRINDAEDLASQVQRVFTQPNFAIQLAHAGRELVQEQFTEEKMLENYEAYLLGLLK